MQAIQQNKAKHWKWVSVVLMHLAPEVSLMICNCMFMQQCPVNCYYNRVHNQRCLESCMRKRQPPHPTVLEMAFQHQPRVNESQPHCPISKHLKAFTKLPIHQSRPHNNCIQQKRCDHKPMVPFLNVYQLLLE